MDEETSLFSLSELVLCLLFSPVFNRDPGFDVAGVNTAADVFFLDIEFELCGDTPVVVYRLNEPVFT